MAKWAWGGPRAGESQARGQGGRTDDARATARNRLTRRPERPSIPPPTTRWLASDGSDA